MGTVLVARSCRGCGRNDGCSKNEASPQGQWLFRWARAADPLADENRSRYYKQRLEGGS
jgi:hypothetical protein